jgi:hypothetical protein
MSAITAKVKVGTRAENRDADDNVYSVNLQFFADYADDRNKAWSYATPAISVQMTVLPEVAEHFPLGQAITLTFEAE